MPHRTLTEDKRLKVDFLFNKNASVPKGSVFNSLITYRKQITDNEVRVLRNVKSVLAQYISIGPFAIDVAFNDAVISDAEK